MSTSRSSVFLRTPFNYDRNDASDASGLFCDDVSLTKQQFRDETDINFIVKQFIKTGALPDNVRVPTYGDFDQVNDYQSALNIVLAADDAFMQMPADIRSRFNNDAAQFLDFVHNPANRDEAKKFGLLLDNSIASDIIPPAAIPAASSGGSNGNS